MNKLIEIKNLCKKYYTEKKEIVAIDDISLDIYDDEFIAIVGPSGCGKSTLLNIIGKIDNKSSGEVIFNNDIKVGYMLQDDCLLPWLNILDNCLLGLKINNLITTDNVNYVKKLINTYGLKEFMYNYPSSLSGGMRQRAALIRTLSLKPDVLLLDEPFSALDYQTRLKVADDVYRIIKENKKTVIMITHDISEACSVADRVVVLTARPSVVKKEFNIELGDSPINNRKNPKFVNYYDAIWKEIDDDYEQGTQFIFEKDKNEKIISSFNSNIYFNIYNINLGIFI